MQLSDTLVPRPPAVQLPLDSEQLSDLTAAAGFVSLTLDPPFPVASSIRYITD